MLRFVLASILTALWASSVLAATPKIYQVTGPVLEVREDAIVIDKDGEAWEVSKDEAITTPDGKMPKKGDKVTVKYRMVATELKATNTAPPPATKKK